MSIKNIHLYKLLKLIELPDKKLISILRQDIRTDLRKGSGGGNFYSPFWSDAKLHVAGDSDLDQSTISRISSNKGRERLYPQLRDGFLDWWDNKRRWRNETFSFQRASVKTQYKIDELGVIVKVENLLGFSIGEQDSRLIYPYFSEDLLLSIRNSQLGLWLLSTALPEHKNQNMRILDIFKSKSFAIEDLPFLGNERDELIEHFARIIKKWEELKLEYPI